MNQSISITEALKRIPWPALTARDEDTPKFITVNGAAVPLDKNGQPAGKVGEKLKEGDPAQAAKALGEKSKAGTLSTKDNAVIVSAPSLGDTPLHELTKGPNARALEKAIAGDIENQISGEKINLSTTKASHLISSALNRGEGGLPHMAAVQNVHSIMAGAIPTASTPDEKNQQDVKSVQRFYGAMKYDDGMYRVTMTVKEYEGSRFVEIDGVKKLYDLKLDKKIPEFGNAALANKGVPPKPGTSELSIEQLLSGVKEKPILSRKDAAEDAKLRRPGSLGLDASSKRHFDDNGFLHVARSHISKETVNPYYGREIPGWEDLSLDPDKIYYGYRQGQELAKAAATFNGLPILLGHHAESADNPQKEHRVGSLGTDAAFNPPYLDNSLIFTDADAIKSIESGRTVELSGAYRYQPVFTPGRFKGEHYDFIMTNIRGNHVALVEEGRAGPDVAVADQQPNPLRRKLFMNIKELLAKMKEFISSAEKQGEAIDPDSLAKGKELIGDIDTLLDNGKAEDDSLDDLGAEIYALIDTIEDHELAGKIKAKIEEARAAGNNAIDNGPAANPAKPEDKAPAGAQDDDNADQFMAKLAEVLKTVKPEELWSFQRGLENMADKQKFEDIAGKIQSALNGAPPAPAAADNEPDKEKEKPLTAQDAALIRKQAQADAQQHLRSLQSAERLTRPLCGELDPLTFDSAADIYRHALKASGHMVNTSDTVALKDMVTMALDAKSKAAITPAFDSRQMSGAFAGLNRINIQQ